MTVKTESPKITPFLWYDSQAEEAARQYVSIFKNSRILATSRYDKSSAQAAGRPEGSAMTVVFELDGQRFMALNGGPQYNFTEAISFMAECKDQAEVDYLWAKLGEGGQPGPCGWLKDKYGLSWQVVPKVLGEMMTDKDPRKSARVMQAMLKMSKIDIAELERAYGT